ncbi:hypothetical protein ACHAWO_004041 [Cyclotella atomus]|uniref:Calmodulin-lysine N-methyltransferase n=1 Tax=Cyclotella atomus TaxID=382360 RepID=A0ABD3NX81_9STRA
MTNPKAAPSNSNKKKGSTNPKKATNAKKAEQPKTKQTAPNLAQLPPIEAPNDYPDLLETARSLTPQEATEELLECARYGESDAVRAIIEVHSTNSLEFINTTDSGGSTALHKAAANGHVSTVSLLLVKGAQHIQNENGATPLHWAAGAGKCAVCKVLLDHFDALSKSDEKVKMLDVLLKNSFGRSALTEAFTSGDTETVGVLLNHDSAEEDKLIGGMKKEEVDSVDADGERVKKKDEIVHEFDFRRGLDELGSDEERQSVFIRELPIAHPDNPFGQSAVEDTTGLSIWCASLIMARWLSSPTVSSRLENKHILELGAGCAVPSFAAMAYASPASVTISDLNPDTMENIEHNIGLNTSSKCEVKACTIDWEDETTYPEQKMDYVICSDCIYQKDLVPLLKKVVIGTLKNPLCESDNSSQGPSFLYVAPEGGRDGLPEFIAMMKSHGFRCITEEIAPDVYRENPLKSGDEEDCFLHFHELASSTYVLYEFQRR